MNSSKDDSRWRTASVQHLFLSCVLLLLQAGSSPARADSWQSRSLIPGARAAHSAVWTGREMIVWGGGIDGSFLDTGARYTPSSDSWRMTSPYGAPAPRWFHAAVWTGAEMIVWGGRSNFSGDNNFNDGARYNPATDEWTPVNTQGAPAARSQCAAVWTGEEMIIWGGATEGGVPLASGAAYNPITDEWRPISSASGLAPRMEPTAVWTGSEMIVFGGVDATQPGWLSYADGARYNPFTDSWTPLSAYGAPGSRTGHTAVWTGERMIVWGGRELPSYSVLNDGAIYNPGSDIWTPIPFSYEAPQARMLHAAVWTGAEMIVWGGQADEAGTLLNTGARYNPATGLWTPTTQENAPGKRMFWRPDLGIWTGRGMLICAGSDYPASLDSTYLYSLTDPPCPPVIREQPQSVSAVVGDAVTLSVGAGDCVTTAHPSATQTSAGPYPQSFQFETDARAGQLQFDYDFFTVPDSLRVYYEGQLIFDRSLSGQGTIRVPFGPGSIRSVNIVINEDGGLSSTAWEYTVSFKPPPLRYQWRKDGNWIADETNATLHLSSVRLEDAGDYSVDVANNSSGVISAIATLTVSPPPPTNCIPGLVAWWRGDGDATDVTGAHNGTLLYGTTFSPGVAGQAFTFDLSRARVSIPDDDAFKLTDSLSFEGWIKVASYAPGLIFIRGDNRGGLDPYHMSMQPSGQLHWGINTADNNFAFVQSPNAVPLGEWIHVAAVLDGATGNLGLYVNGSLVSQTNTSLRPLRDLDPNSEPTLGIGNHGGTFHHFPFHGSVDEWALYSRALSAAEIAGIFQAGAAGKCSITNPPPTRVFDLSTDFSSASNPAGAWSYGYTATLGGQFNLLTFAKTFGANNSVPISAWQVSDVLGPTVNRVMGPGVAVSEGGAFTAPAGTIYVWPGNDGAPGHFGVIRFTVPPGGGGVYRLESTVRPTFDGPVSGDADFHILKNGRELFGEFLAPNTGTGWSNTLALASGDTIDFVVGRGADGSPDHSSLKVRAVITAVTQVSMGVDAVFFVAAGGLRVTGHAPQGTICRVERSINLVDWEPVGVAQEISAGTFQFIDAQPPAGPACFYRMLGTAP